MASLADSIGLPHTPPAIVILVQQELLSVICFTDTKVMIIKPLEPTVTRGSLRRCLSSTTKLGTPAPVEIDPGHLVWHSMEPWLRRRFNTKRTRPCQMPPKQDFLTYWRRRA